VAPRNLPDSAPTLRLDEAGAVPLKPDLCLIEQDQIVWVGDAKYKRLAEGEYRNADLYQLLAYTVALNLPSGTLVYAADVDAHSAEHVVVRAGKRLRLVALDLCESPRGVRRQVDALARRIERRPMPKRSSSAAQRGA
jgi:5-methylcytosine-specific restriction enzyme subunit McrC